MTLDRRKLRYGGNATLAFLAVLGLCVLVNVIAARHFKRWDWTGSKVYSLSDKTVKILQGLTSDIDVTVLLQPDNEVYDEVRETLGNYSSHSPHLKIEFLDPATQPARVAQMLAKFGIDPRGDTTAVVFSTGERHKHVPVGDLADYDMGEASFGGPARLKAFKGEIAFTSALLSVTEATQKTIYFLKGHGEPASEDPGPNGLGLFVEDLKRENLRVESTGALGRSPLPKDCDVLIIAGPTAGFLTPEADALGAFLDSGGRVLALLDPPFSSAGSLQQLGIEKTLHDRGIAIGDDIVLDPAQKLPFRTAETFTALDFPAHVITKDLTGTSLVFGLARSAAPVDPAPPGWTAAPLVRTTSAGWGERDLQHLQGSVTKGADDLQGPVALASASERSAPPSGSRAGRIVATGDSDMAQNQFLSAGAKNRDFLLNAVHWLTGTEQQIGIAPREPEQVHLSMTSRQQKAVMIFTLLGMPGLAVACGIFIWLFRRG